MAILNNIKKNKTSILLAANIAQNAEIAHRAEQAARIRHAEEMEAQQAYLEELQRQAAVKEANEAEQNRSISWMRQQFHNISRMVSSINRNMGNLSALDYAYYFSLPFMLDALNAKIHHLYDSNDIQQYHETVSKYLACEENMSGALPKDMKGLQHIVTLFEPDAIMSEIFAMHQKRVAVDTTDATAPVKLLYDRLVNAESYYSCAILAGLGIGVILFSWKFAIACTFLGILAVTLYRNGVIDDANKMEEEAFPKRLAEYHENRKTVLKVFDEEAAELEKKRCLLQKTMTEFAEIISRVPKINECASNIILPSFTERKTLAEFACNWPVWFKESLIHTERSAPQQQFTPVEINANPN